MGPFDLGNNIGHPILDGTMHDELKEAIAKIQQAAKDNHKSSGIYSTSGDQARVFADQGFNMVCCLEESHRRKLTYVVRQVHVMTDMVALPTFMTSSLNAARGSYVHSALNVGKGAMAGLANMAGRSER